MAGVSINFESWDWQEGRSGLGSCLLTPSGTVQINSSPGAQRSGKPSDLQARQMSAVPGQPRRDKREVWLLP